MKLPLPDSRSWPGFVAVIIAIGVATTIVILAVNVLNNEGHVSADEATLLATVLGALVGALGTYLGLHRGDAEPPSERPISGGDT